MAPEPGIRWTPITRLSLSLDSVEYPRAHESLVNTLGQDQRGPAHHENEDNDCLSHLVTSLDLQPIRGVGEGRQTDWALSRVAQAADGRWGSQFDAELYQRSIGTGWATSAAVAC